MLTAQDRAIVKSTVPLLESGGLGRGRLLRFRQPPQHCSASPACQQCPNCIAELAEAAVVGKQDSDGLTKTNKTRMACLSLFCCHVIHKIRDERYRLGNAVRDALTCCE